MEKCSDETVYRLVNFLVNQCYFRLSCYAKARISKDDLFQEAMLTIWDVAYPTYNPALGTSFLTWCWTCIFSRFANIVKLENKELQHRLEIPGLLDSYFSSNDEYESKTATALCDPVSLEDRVMFLDALNACASAAPDVIQFILGESDITERSRLKLLTTAKRRLNKTNGNGNCQNRQRIRISISNILRFLGVKNVRVVRAKLYNQMSQG